MSYPGVFITFEGGDGCGKSTQIARLADTLRRAGADVLVVREPGGTVVGEAVRRLLLDPQHATLDSVAELLLYEASRAQNVAEVLRPALAAGRWVLLDRFADSSMAYQGFGRGIDRATVETLNRVATGGLVPEATILLDIDPQEGVRRATGEGADRLESAGAEFHERVRAGFLEMAAAETDRFIVIDASGTPDEIERGISDALAVRCDRFARIVRESL